MGWVLHELVKAMRLNQVNELDGRGVIMVIKMSVEVSYYH